MNSVETFSPFSLNPVRTLEHFFGRDKETRRVLSRLQQRESVSIVGSAGSGRTSFAFHVMHPAVRKQYGLAEDHAFVYLDGCQLSNCTQEQCYRTILEEAIHQVEVKATASAAVSRDLERAIHSIDSQTAFQGLHTLLRTLQTNGWPLVIVLDDFEFLAQNSRLESYFFAALRSLASNYQVAYLVSSQLPLDTLDTRVAGSPFWNIFTPVPLRALTPAESREFVAAAMKQAEIEFPLFAQDWIITLGNGEPYRLQKVGAATFQMWRKQDGTLKVENYEEIRRQLCETQASG